MNADAFRQLYAYHFAENRSLWIASIMPLSKADFLAPSPYSIGSIRNHAVHLMLVEQAWFSNIRGVEALDWTATENLNDRDDIRAQWDNIEREIQIYLDALMDEMLLTHPIQNDDDQMLALWQILLHVVNHGTDHRAQLRRLLHDVGVATPPQDYVFYLYDQATDE